MGTPSALLMYQRVFFGPPLAKFDEVKDANNLEKVYMFVFVGLILLVGIYPAILTNVLNIGTSPISSLFIR